MEHEEVLLKLASLANSGIEVFMEKQKGIVIGQFESIVESRIILNLCIQYLDSINNLAKADYQNLPSAMVLSRSIFECAMNVVWLLHPHDIFETESRFLARLENYEKWIIDTIKFYKDQGWSPLSYENELKSVSEFRLSVQELLLLKGRKSTSVPSIRNMLKLIKEDRKYINFRILSNYTHGGYGSTLIYRKHLGNSKEHGLFIEIADWRLVYHVAWPAFEIASEFYIDRATFSKVTSIYTDDFKKQIRDAITIKP